MDDFGVIIGCCDQDFMLAQGTCASLRDSLGDVPICLLVDGSASASPVKAMQKTYGVEVLDRQRVSNEFLRKNSFGWGLTKMIAFWESPWSNFLFLDADTIVWGNVLEKFGNFQDFDLIIDKPPYSYSDESVSHWFFDIKGVEKYFPNFDWRKYRDNYFCTGTFFAKRNVFSLEEYQDILKFMSTHPGIFKYGEMGLLNFMIFRALQEGRARVAMEDMQSLIPDYNYEQLEKRFPVNENGPVFTEVDANVIHWSGPKPSLFRQDVYAAPMTFYRRQFLRDAWDYMGWGAEASLQKEDLMRYVFLYKNKIRKRVKNFLSKKG